MNTPLRLVFAMGDVGGTRALQPVIAEALSRGIDCHILNNGFIAREPRIPNAQYFSLDEPVSDEQSDQILNQISPHALILSSSVSDTLPLQLAISASLQKIKVLHLLDFWANYKNRLVLDDLTRLVPERYAVMDDYACQQASAEGIDPQTLIVTGSPAFAHIQTNDLTSIKNDSGSAQIIFVSEPVVADRHSGSPCSVERGYNQYQVLQSLLQSVNVLNCDVTIHLFAHPREDAAALHQTWQEHRGSLRGGVVNEADKRRTLSSCHGVTGMASILLYEAWLRGLPVLSMQPELTLDSLRYLSTKNGLVFVDQFSDITPAVASWLRTLSCKRDSSSAIRELEHHRHSVENVLNAIFDMTFSITE